MAKRIDWAQLANDRLAGRTWDQQVKEKKSNGNGNGSKEKAAPTADKKTPEKNRVKNQAEIDRVKEQNEKVDRERTEAKLAVDESLQLVAEALKLPNLSEQDRARLQWVKKSVEGAKSQLAGGDNYLVEVFDISGKTKAKRMEGVPVDGLMEVVADLTEHTKRQINEIQQSTQSKKESRKVKEAYDLEAVRSGINGTEQKTKLAWYDVLNKLPAKDRLKDAAYKLMEKWEAADRKNAADRGEKFEGYDEDVKKQQLGEALRQYVEEYLKIDDQKLKDALEGRNKRLGKYEKLLKALEKSSLPYFAFHYPKNYKDGKSVSPLDAEQKKEQHLYTEREANLIAKDSSYRAVLLEKFIADNELPDGFEKMSLKEQNYNLAMLALAQKRVLVLPKEQPVPQEILETEQAPTPTPSATPPQENAPNVNPTPVNPVKEHKLQNTNEPYDWENQLNMIPEGPVKGPEKVDKKLFLIDISEIAKRMAWTKAEEKLRQKFDHKGGFFGRVVKNAWKGLSENNYRLKFYKEALEEIKNDNNLMAAISGRLSGTEIPGQGKNISSEYYQILDRVVEEYKKDVVSSQSELGDSMNQDPQVQARFAELLHRYRTNKWDGAAYNGLDKRAAVELFVKENIAGYINKQSSAKWTTDVDRLKEAKGLLYANNFYEILESIDKNQKEQIDTVVKEVMDKNPEANIETIREAISKQVEGVRGLNLQLGLKDRDLINNRPKGILNLYERMVDWGEKHKVLGRIALNPFVVGAAATLTSQGVQRAIKWAAMGGAVAAGASGFWVPLGAGALVGGAYRAFKRGKDVKYDIAQEQRNETLGRAGSDILDAKKGWVVNKESLRYGDKVVMSLNESITKVDQLKNKTNFSEEEKQALAEIYARLQLEREFVQDRDNKLPKVDLFKLDAKEGDRYGTTAYFKGELRIKLKDLKISEQELNAMAAGKKAEILKIIEQVNEEQEKFRRVEIGKSFFGGAVMGFAGGVLAQEAMHLGGQQLEKLWGGSYFKNQHTSFDRIVDWAKGSQYYQSHFGGGAAAAGGVEHIVTGSRDQTSMEWLKGLKGHITGGDIEKIHTQNWYDNPTGEASHIHNENELRFYISKDSAGSIHFKVPVQGDGSWNENGWTDLDKAGTEGRIKMLFVPDGNNAHDAIVLDVNPATHEVIIPKDSNIANLFDSATGRPKGTGFFGLAEEVGSRSDGSKNFVWISSEKNNGTDINFGKVNITQEFIPDKPAVAPVEYDQAIATVPPQRKVFYRPGENKVEEKKQKKKAEKEAAKKAKEEKQKKEKKEREKKIAEEKAKAEKDHKADSHGNHGEHGGGGGGGTEAGKKPNTETGEVKKAPEFTGEALKRYTNPKFAAELFALYEEDGGEAEKINKKSVKYAIEGEKHKGVLKKDKPVRKDLAKAVWEMEQALIKAGVISQEQSDEFYGDIAEAAAAELKKAEAARAAATTPKAGTENPGKPGKGPAPAEAPKPEPELTGEDEFGNVSSDFLKKTGKKVHLIMDGEQMPDSDKIKVLKVLDEALDKMDSATKTGILNKFNFSHKGTELSKGLLLSFESNVSKIGFDRKNTLHIPTGATAEDVKVFLSDYYEKQQERKKKIEEEKQKGSEEPKAKKAGDDSKSS